MNTKAPGKDSRKRSTERGQRWKVTFNVFEVTLDRESGETRVFDVLDTNAEATVVTLDELRSRLG
jgi:hypothetical protein